MTALLIKLFVRDNENIKEASVRTAYGTLGSVTGIFVNLLLAGIKYFAGIISGSISVTADAINNLSDAGSSIVSLAGVKLSARPADKGHPYGHGRLEYISALAVAVLVFLMGFELLKSSIDKILNPVPVTFNWLALVILIVSIFAKLWLGIFNKKLGKKINSAPMMAVMKDCFSDCLATGVAALSIVVSAFSEIAIDGYLGIIVAGFILLAGFNISKETLGVLLGNPPEKEYVEMIENKILSYDHIVGVHDLIVHDYGPSRRFASAHAEVPANIDIMEAHDVIDLIERDIMNEMGLLISIHMDPIIVDDERINTLRQMTSDVVKEIDPKLSIHDFRVVEGPTHTNLIFDILLTHTHKDSHEEIINQINEKLSKIDERFFTVITIDHSFN